MNFSLNDCIYGKKSIDSVNTVGPRTIFASYLKVALIDFVCLIPSVV